MDMTWVTDRIALGGAIWSDGNMQEVARSGVTHIIDMQIEFDDTELARPYGIEVLWNGTDDDFQPKPAELFEKGVKFAQAALGDNGCKLYIHCAAGVHRAAMMTLALLGAMGWEVDEAMRVIQGRRPVVDFADVYVRSVEHFLRQQGLSRGAEEASDSRDGKKRGPVKSRNRV
jgi:protein-tyrosine phosphatase